MEALRTHLGLRLDSVRHGAQTHIDSQWKYPKNKAFIGIGDRSGFVEVTRIIAHGRPTDPRDNFTGFSTSCQAMSRR